MTVLFDWWDLVHVADRSCLHVWREEVRGICDVIFRSCLDFDSSSDKTDIAHERDATQTIGVRRVDQNRCRGLLGVLLWNRITL